METQYVCTGCGKIIPTKEFLSIDETLCPYCGALTKEQKIPKEETSRPVRNSPQTTPKLVFCQNCGKKFSSRAHQCPHCGWKQQESCRVCFERIPYDSKVCPICGDPAPFTNYQTKEINSGNAQLSKSNSCNSTTPSRDASLLWVLFSLDGRIDRGQYWLGLMATVLLFLLSSLFLSDLIATKARDIEDIETRVGIVLGIIIFLFYTWTWFAVSVKRFHDFNRTGFWSFILLLPFIGIISQIIIGCIAGDDKPNDFGESALRSKSLFPCVIVMVGAPTLFLLLFLLDW